MDDEHREAETLLSKHLITARYFEYLYSPNYVIVGEESDELVAFGEDGLSEEDHSVIELREGQH